MPKSKSDPEQKLLIAVWMQALNDINRGILFENGVIKDTIGIDKVKELQAEYKDAMQWIVNMDGTFPIVADAFDTDTKEFQRKTLKVIAESKLKITERSKTTNEYIYATVSRFRDYEKAFINTLKEKFPEIDS